MILADSHAHLEMVAERLGPAFLEGLLRAYGEAWAAAGPRVLEGAATGPAAGEGALPLLLDAGVEAGDLGRRLAATRGAEGSDRPFLRRAAGIWPSAEALAEPAAALDRLEAEIRAVTAAAPGFRLAAVGECGLDYHHKNASRAAQAELFARQIALAEGLGLPLLVHSREAAADTLALLAAEARKIPVLIHCFGYGPAEARAFLDAGCFISFAGNLSYKGAAALREALLLVPEERLLLETDAPYMNPEPRRGRPSSPLDIERSYALAAELRGRDPEALAAAVSRNALRLFG